MLITSTIAKVNRRLSTVFSGTLVHSSSLAREVVCDPVSPFYSGYPDILGYLNSCRKETSPELDPINYSRILRLCCDDQDFPHRSEAPKIAKRLLEFHTPSIESSNGMLCKLISRVITEATSLTEAHLALYRRYRSQDPSDFIGTSLVSRVSEFGESVASMSAREVSLWLDILTSSGQTDLPIFAGIRNHAILLLSDSTTQIDHTAVCYLLRSLSYCPGLNHTDSQTVILGSFKRIIPVFDSFELPHALITMRAVRRLCPKWRKNPRINEFMDLVYSEISRNFHLLNSHDLVDSLIVYPNQPRLVESVLSILPELTPRQISLVVWSLCKSEETDNSDAITRILQHFDESDADRIAAFTIRDWSLILHGLSRPHLNIPAEIAKIFDLFFSQKIKFQNNLQQISMILSASIKSLGPKDYRVVDLVRQLPDTLHSIRERSSMSTHSILSILNSLSIVGRGKTSLVTTDLGRVLYARVSRGELSSDEAAFALFLLRKDKLVAASFLPHIDLGNISNKNLINCVKAVAEMDTENTCMYPIFDEVDRRYTTLKPAQFVDAIILIAKLDTRESNFDTSNLVKILTSSNNEFVAQFTPRSLVDLFVNLDPILRPRLSSDKTYRDIKNGISVAMIEKLKTSSHSYWSGEDLVLLAKEFVRLGRNGIKPNLRDRLLVRLMIAIKTRVIPTPLLLNNLKVIDSLGTFQHLPIHLQEHLYKKATVEQRQGMRRPNSRTERGEEGAAQEREQEDDDEEYEAEEDTETAVSQFIQKIRAHNS